MKNKKQFFRQVGKRFGMMVILPLAGFAGASALYLLTLSMWLLGFIIIPVGILQMRYFGEAPSWNRGKQQWEEEPALPRWAWAWDDSADIEIRGRPQATFVWNYGLSWPIATFVHLQFYNPLANIRAKVVAFSKRHSRG